MLQTTVAVLIAATNFVTTSINPLTSMALATTTTQSQSQNIESKIESEATLMGVDPVKALAVARAENSRLNPLATNSNGDDSGIYQFQNETFTQKCIDEYGFADSLDQKNDVDVQIKCAVQLMKDGQWWRWASSRDKWDPQYAGCSCVRSARMKNADIPLQNAKDFIANSQVPRVGGLILMKYKDSNHVAYVEAVTPDGIKVYEGNYYKCIVKERLVKLDDPHIIGYWHKES